MPEVSHAMLISVGLIGPKARPRGVTDGQQVKIPVLELFWQTIFSMDLSVLKVASKGGQNGRNWARYILVQITRKWR
jgi:hypothetical protein